MQPPAVGYSNASIIPPGTLLSCFLFSANSTWHLSVLYERVSYSFFLSPSLSLSLRTPGLLLTISPPSRLYFGCFIHIPCGVWNYAIYVNIVLYIFVYTSISLPVSVYGFQCHIFVDFQFDSQSDFVHLWWCSISVNVCVYVYLYKQ